MIQFACGMEKNMFADEGLKKILLHIDYCKRRKFLKLCYYALKNYTKFGIWTWKIILP